jgi:hypothetical protein
VNSVNYTVTASCTGAGSQTPVASQAAVTVQPFITGGGTGACTTVVPGSTGSITSFGSAGTIGVFYFSLNNGGLKQINTSTFAAIYESVWPGLSGNNVYFRLPATQYVSASFTVPPNFFTASGAPASEYGDYTIGQSDYSVPISMTISTTKCGDFAPPATGSTVVPGCYVNQGTPNNNFFMQWRNSGTCVLTAGQSYYLNIINADISALTPSGGKAVSTSTTGKCPGNICNDPIQNGPGNWSGWNGTGYQ